MPPAKNVSVGARFIAPAYATDTLTVGNTYQYRVKATTDLRINNENNEILSSMTVIARRHKVPTKQSQKERLLRGVYTE